MKRISLICLVVICLLLVGCGSKEVKEVKNLDNFQTLMLNADFSVNNNINNYQEYDYITGSYLAVKDGYTIEMVTYDNEDSAKKAYNNLTKKFKEMKASGATADTSKGANFQTYKMISNNYYMVTSRVDNTMMFTKAPLEYKDEIDKLYTDMGY